MAAALQTAENKEEQREEREAYETPAQRKADPLPAPKAGVTGHPGSA